jgi:hypothetical protein
MTGLMVPPEREEETVVLASAASAPGRTRGVREPARVRPDQRGDAS